MDHIRWTILWPYILQFWAFLYNMGRDGHVQNPRFFKVTLLGQKGYCPMYFCMLFLKIITKNFLEQYHVTKIRISL